MKRFNAFEKFVSAARSFGATASEMTGGGHVHRRERDVDLAVGERLPGARLDPVERHDVAALGGLDLLAIVRVHPEHARHPHLAHLVAGVEDRIAR